MAEHTALHTPLPGAVGSNGRSIIREIPGMCDGCDHYMVAVMSAHSLLPVEEAKANAALLVRTANTSPAVADLVEVVESALRILERDFPNGQLVIDARAALSRFRELEKGNG